MSLILKEIIIENKEIAPGIFKLIFKSEYISHKAKPGQFINIKCSENLSTVLRRPISISSVDEKEKSVTVFYQVKGVGTAELARKHPGNILDFIGPLGVPFDVSDKYKKIAVVGGGIGIFPLLFLLEKLQAQKAIHQAKADKQNKAIYQANADNKDSAIHQANAANQDSAIYQAKADSQDSAISIARTVDQNKINHYNKVDYNKVDFQNKVAYIGFRNRENVILTDEFKASSDELYISTEDGSLGYKGLITHLLAKDIKVGYGTDGKSVSKKGYDIIYTCGPEAMMKEVVKLAIEYNIKCQVSLEQRMGCGIGSCRACAFKILTDDGWEYKRVCKDGPVFWGKEVVFDGNDSREY